MSDAVLSATRYQFASSPVNPSTASLNTLRPSTGSPSPGENGPRGYQLLSKVSLTPSVAVAKGVLHRNTASRYKSRMARQAEAVISGKEA